MEELRAHPAGVAGCPKTSNGVYLLPLDRLTIMNEFVCLSILCYIYILNILIYPFAICTAVIPMCACGVDARIDSSRDKTHHHPQLLALHLDGLPC